MTHASLKGPAILTGAAFGPEASIIAVVLCFAIAILLLRRAAKSGRIQSPLWYRTNSATPSVGAAVTGVLDQANEP